MQLEGYKVFGGSWTVCRKTDYEQEVKWWSETQTVVGNGDHWRAAGI